MSIFDTLCGDFDHHSSLIDEFLDLSPGTSLDLVAEDPSIVMSSLDSNSQIAHSSTLGWDQDVLLSNAVLPELNPLLEMGESAEEDFQKMLNDWESHLGSIPEDNNSVETSDDLDSHLPGSEDLFEIEEPKKELLRLNSESSKDDQVPVEPRMTIGRKTLAGIVISSGPGGYFETYEVLEASDVDNLLQQFESNEDALLTPNSGSDPNQASQIISAVQNHFATSTKNISGQGNTPKIVRSQRIKDALPVEIIEKIKASSQRSKTIAIIEPLTSKTARDNSGESSSSKFPKTSGFESRFKEAASNLNRNKLRQLGITQSPQRVQKVSLDHDYCSPTKPKRGRYNHSSSKENRSEQAMKKRSLLLGGSKQTTQSKLIIASNQVVSRRDSDNKKDSGLESGDVSDASDSSSSGNIKAGLKSGLYTKLPPYLTTLKSTTASNNKAFVPVLDCAGSYDRLPPYIKGIASPQKSMTVNNLGTDSVLKSTAPKEKKKLNLVQYRHRREELLNNANRAKEESSSPVTIVELSENGKAEVIIEKALPTYNNTLKPQPSATTGTTVAGRSTIPPRQYRRNNVSPLRKRTPSSSSSSYSSSSSSSFSSSSDDDEYSKSRRKRQHRRRRRRSFSSDSLSSESSRRISSSSRRRRDDSRGRRRSSSRSSISRSRSRRGSRDSYSVKNNSKQRHDQKRRDDRIYEERRVVYVGKIKEGTTRADIRKRFESFGPIEEISVHFRDRGDNYGFVTFKYRSDAYNAIEHGNDNPSLPRVDLCFGGRRTFCKEKYSDLDSVNTVESAAGYSALDLDYDLLLKKARGELKKN